MKLPLLKHKSSVVLGVIIIVMILFLPIWHLMVSPSIIRSELERIDLLYGYDGAFGYVVAPSPIVFNAHIYATEAQGENVTLKMDLHLISGQAPMFQNSTYVFDKFTRQNVRDAVKASKPREGYDPLFPSHLKMGEDIQLAWLDNLNTTATLEFVESITEEGVTLYKYFVNKTVVDPNYFLEGWPHGFHNCTLTTTKTILIEPLSGLWTYTENETFSLTLNSDPPLELAFLTYKSTLESKAEKLIESRTLYESMLLLELYIPVIVGVVVIVLGILLFLNVRRLRRKDM
ncbi:MAG: hypothetical protein JSV05_06275 [Candidatus Bathyarchaeota archaeon]|nr:MAG: hypothetical protein JSV05_06275 [Candidatus Bathyarchaeota archaeon]